MNERYEHFFVETDRRGVVTVTLDVRDRPMNVFDSAVIGELERIVDGLASRDDVAVVVFRSGKESGFLAGADIKAIRGIDSAEHAHELVERGQRLFAHVEQLPMTTVAELHGPCLGGGLEFALACDHRVARDNSATQIGLPEIKLGLIPGWGGTQRLPRLVGCSVALSMILQGRSLGTREAVSVGLVDRAICPQGWESGVANFVDECLHAARHEGPSPTSRRRVRDRLRDSWPLRRLVLSMAMRRVASKKRHYPALPAAIRAVAASFDRHVDGYRAERDEFVRLWGTETSRNLSDLFFARESARGIGTWVGREGRIAHEHPIRSLGVVGAGAMGAGIGQLATLRGFDVKLVEADESAATAGRQRIDKLFRKLAERKGWSPQQLQTSLKSFTVGTELSELDPCDVVVEAVVEREDVKHDVFSRLDRTLRVSTILATNTSSLSVDSIAAATRRPEKVAGLHFFNPVHRMELVEVVRGKQTDNETVAKLVGFVRALGKTPVVTRDAPGFLVNRILFPYLGEAVMMIREGGDIAEIDREVRRFGMPMGPLELFDQVGLDVALHVARSLREVLPDADLVTEPLTAMTDANRLGKKSGIGFYRHGRRGHPRPAAVPRAFPRQYRPSPTDAFVDDGMSMVQRRAVYPMLAEAVRCLEEDVVPHAWAVDLGMVLGTGFAPHTGGPLHLVDSIGPSTVLDNLRRLHAFYGDRFTPPAMLLEVVEQGRRFLDHSDDARSSPVKPTTANRSAGNA